jgi:hypothetical protein
MSRSWLFAVSGCRGRGHIKRARVGLGDWCSGRWQQSQAGPDLVLAAAYLVAGGCACGVPAGRAQARPECEVSRVFTTYQRCSTCWRSRSPGPASTLSAWTAGELHRAAALARSSWTKKDARLHRFSLCRRNEVLQSTYGLPSACPLVATPGGCSLVVSYSSCCAWWVQPVGPAA